MPVAATTLSEVPFDNIELGLEVISATGKLGKVIELCNWNLPAKDRDPSIVIAWEDGQVSWVFHHQATKVTLKKVFKK